MDTGPVQKRKPKQRQISRHQESRIVKLHCNIVAGFHRIKQILFSLFPKFPSAGNGVLFSGAAAFRTQ